MLEIKIVTSEILKIVLQFIYTLDVQTQINNQVKTSLLDWIFENVEMFSRMLWISWKPPISTISSC